MDMRVNVVCPDVNQAGLVGEHASGKYESYLKNEVISLYGKAGCGTRGSVLFAIR